VSDIEDWFASALLVRLAAQDLRALYRCKVCAALVEGPWRAAHRAWHLDQGEPLPSTDNDVLQ
jgi:hypothetical protein